jgi:hypothetical protein
VATAALRSFADMAHFTGDVFVAPKTNIFHRGLASRIRAKVASAPSVMAMAQSH